MNNKTQILSGINAWIDNKVDQLAADNIWMALAANTVKRVASDMMESVVPMDALELMMTNHGVVDANILAEEVISSLDNIVGVSHRFGGGMTLNLSKGLVQVELPGNAAVMALLGGNNVINFRPDDIRELARYINNAKN